MIYLDELLPSHQKILFAGSLIGPQRGGRLVALGLYVSAIAYCRQHLTDGIVPDGYLLEVSQSREAIDALRRAKLLKKLRGSRWAIHDFHVWNKTAEQILKDRGLSKTRQQRHRERKLSLSRARHGVTSALSRARNAAVTRTPVPRTPYPDLDPNGTGTRVEGSCFDQRTTGESINSRAECRATSLLAGTSLREKHISPFPDDDQPNAIQPTTVPVASVVRDRSGTAEATAHTAGAIHRVEGVDQGPRDPSRICQPDDGERLESDGCGRARTPEASGGLELIPVRMAKAQSGIAAMAADLQAARTPKEMSARLRELAARAGHRR